MKILRTACPGCDTPTEKARHVFRRDFSAAASIMPFRAYDVCACPACGLFYAGNIEESMPLADYYAMLSRYEGASFVLSAPMKRVYEREAAFIAKHVGKEARILDIGCVLRAGSWVSRSGAAIRICSVLSCRGKIAPTSRITMESRHIKGG